MSIISVGKAAKIFAGGTIEDLGPVAAVVPNLYRVFDVGRGKLNGRHFQFSFKKSLAPSHAGEKTPGCKSFAVSLAVMAGALLWFYGPGVRTAQPSGTSHGL
jgi:hypothetical protein